MSFADTEGLAQGKDDNGSFSREGAEGEIKQILDTETMLKLNEHIKQLIE